MLSYEDLLSRAVMCEVMKARVFLSYFPTSSSYNSLTVRGTTYGTKEVQCQCQCLLRYEAGH